MLIFGWNSIRNLGIPIQCLEATKPLLKWRFFKELAIPYCHTRTWSNKVTLLLCKRSYTVSLAMHAVVQSLCVLSLSILAGGIAKTSPSLSHNLCEPHKACFCAHGRPTHTDILVSACKSWCHIHYTWLPQSQWHHSESGILPPDLLTQHGSLTHVPIHAPHHLAILVSRLVVRLGFWEGR